MAATLKAGLDAPDAAVGTSVGDARAAFADVVYRHQAVLHASEGGELHALTALATSEIPVLAFSPVPHVRSQLALSWGVETFIGASVDHTDEMVRQVDDQLLQIGRVEEGDLVVIVAGSPPGIPGSTNALRIHRMGDAINEVAPAYRRS